MTDIQKKPSRLDLVRDGQKFDLPRTGRLVVGIEKVSEDPHNERKVFRNMDGLIESVKIMGVIEPITVTTLDSGLYQIITGHRRYRAAKIAGLAQIEVLIREPEEERVRRQKSLVSNVQREDIGPVELAEALQSLLDDDRKLDGRQDKLAALIGKDKTWVSRILRILDLPPALRARVATSQLTIPYDAVAAIARLSDATVQEQMIAELLSGGSVRAIRERIQEHKGVGKPADDDSTKPVPKPKQVFHTTQKATVIVQSESASTLRHDRVVAALQEALKAARKAQKQ